MFGGSGRLYFVFSGALRVLVSGLASHLDCMGRNWTIEYMYEGLGIGLDWSWARLYALHIKKQSHSSWLDETRSYPFRLLSSVYCIASRI